MMYNSRVLQEVRWTAPSIRGHLRIAHRLNTEEYSSLVAEQSGPAWYESRRLACRICDATVPVHHLAEHLRTKHFCSQQDYTQIFPDLAIPQWRCEVCQAGMDWSRRPIQQHLSLHDLSLQAYGDKYLAAGTTESGDTLADSGDTETNKAAKKLSSSNNDTSATDGTEDATISRDNVVRTGERAPSTEDPVSQQTTAENVDTYEAVGTTEENGDGAENTDAATKMTVSSLEDRGDRGGRVWWLPWYEAPRGESQPQWSCTICSQQVRCRVVSALHPSELNAPGCLV